MGVASSFFEPQPCNFGKLDVFLRCSNDISIIFWISYWFQNYIKALEPSSPGESKNSLPYGTYFFVITMVWSFCHGRCYAYRRAIYRSTKNRRWCRTRRGTAWHLPRKLLGKQPWLQNFLNFTYFAAFGDNLKLKC